METDQRVEYFLYVDVNGGTSSTGLNECTKWGSNRVRDSDATHTNATHQTFIERRKHVQEASELLQTTSSSLRRSLERSTKIQYYYRTCLPLPKGVAIVEEGFLRGYPKAVPA
jgi:hypothetical protein